MRVNNILISKSLKPITLFKTLSVFVLLVVFSTTVRAGIDESNMRTVLSSTGSPLVVYDNRYNEMLYNPYGYLASFQNKKVENLVKLSLDPKFMYTDNFSMTANVTIEYKTWSGTAFVNNTVTVDLWATFDVNTQNLIIDQSAYNFQGAYYIKATVNTISCNSGVCDPAKLVLEATIRTERYYVMNSGVTGLSHTPTGSAVNTSSYIEFNWDHLAGAEYYELEWVHINDYTLTSGSYAATSALNYNYYKNSTRIETNSNFYRIPKIFDHGYIVYRVRAVGRKGVGFADRWEGVWSAAELGTIASHNAANIIPIVNEYDSDMNWTYQALYGERGGRIDGISFEDGLGRERQNIATNPVTGQIIVNNTYYDDMGRAVISDLPTPVSGGTMNHLTFFNRADINDPGLPLNPPAYAYEYFDDRDNGSCAFESIGFSNQYGAGLYYSSSNPDMDAENLAIPDAEHFPFTRVDYKDDLLDRIDASGEAGASLALRKGHEKRYIDVSSDQDELNQLFGTEIGLASHYQKLVTVDENGQAYVQYLDGMGRTIVSYLTGGAPTQLDALPENQVTSLEHSLITNGVGDIDNLTEPSSTLSYTKFITETGDYNFTYFFTPSQYTAVCDENSICLDCVYDFTMKIEDECGHVYLEETQTVNGEELNTDCTSGVQTLVETSVHLFGELGGETGVTYTITKSLKVNHDAIDDYWCYYFDVSCIEDLSSIFDKLYTETKFENCTTEEGSEESECLFYRNLMLQDMSPNGQYAAFTLTNGIFSFTDPLSIFYTGSTLGNWNSVTYLDEIGNPILVMNNAGSMVSPAALTAAEFIEKFQPSWAISLLPLHPEYCFLQMCIQSTNLNSNEFDEAMLNVHSFSEAMILGYFRPLGSGAPAPNSTSTAFGSSNPYALPSDPFFVANPTLSSQMEDIMETYITLDGVDYSMWDYAILLSSNCEPVNYSACIASFRDAGDCKADYVWLNFRKLYLEAKRNFQIQHVQDGCGADNADIGVTGPFANKVRRWPNYGELEVLNPEDSNAPATDAADVASDCNDACTEYADEWLEKLSGCNINPSILPNVRQALVDLCISGCNQETPFAASTNPNGQTINDILASYGIAETDLCTELLISEPGPYQSVEELTGSVLQPLDECGCDAVLQAQVDLAQHLIDFPTDPEFTTVEEMLAHNTGIAIEEVDPLICACNKISKNGWTGSGYEWSSSANTDLEATGFTIPIELSCTPTSSCPDCDAFSVLFAELVSRFGSEEDLVNSPNYAVILSNFMNEELDQNYGANYYIDFMNRCNATSSEPYCVPNPIVDEWLDMMTLLAFRGQLFTHSAVLLARENIVYEFGNMNTVLSGGSEAEYTVQTVGNNVVMSFGSSSQLCDVIIDNTVGIDFSTIVSFNQVLANSDGCGGIDHFTLSVTYLKCGELVTAWLPASSNCFDVMTCYCGEEEITLCDNESNLSTTTGCYEPLLSELYDLALTTYTDNVARAKLTFEQTYIAKCAETFVTENLTYTDFSNNYQYTLYYYDQAGNLVRTVAPLGVNQLLPSQSAAINASRTGATNTSPSTPILPPNTYETSYAYNSYDQIVKTSNPDQQGDTKFWYDFYGRLVLSQNPVQAGDNKYTYALFDIQGRSVEVGQIDRDSDGGTITFISNSNLRADDKGTAFKNWVYSGIRTEVAFTVYDKPMSSAVSAKFAAGSQKNLRLRVASVVYFDAVGGTTMPLTGYTSATHYSYDIHGNVIESLQDVPVLAPVKQDIKSTQYDFELISGNVKKVEYQKGKNDATTHRYEYDKLNRLTEVLFSTDGVHESREAHYYYYNHGPLARTEIGQNKVQANDLAYTINGWIKGMNSNTLDNSRDIGKDGYTGYTASNTAMHRQFAKDITGYTLGYHEDDYQAISSSTVFEAAQGSGNSFANAIKELFNGNISHSVTAIEGFEIQGGVYSYDQLHRLKKMQIFRNQATLLSSNTWTGNTETQEYYSDYSYDRNGNLQFLNRNGINSLPGSGLDMDEFDYDYTTNTNRLLRVNDTGTDYANYSDVKTGQSGANYAYDAIGQLITDVQEGITLTWRFGDKKVATERKGNVRFDYVYNAFGQRVMKIKKAMSGSNVVSNTVTPWEYSVYSYAANGQVMSTYTVAMPNVSSSHQAFIDEQMIYGLERIGLKDEPELIFKVGDLVPIPDVKNNDLGTKRYEMTNWLGNVNAVITDRKEVVTPEAYITVTAQAGVTIATNTITRNVAGTSWNVSGGASTQTLSQGQYVEWTMGGAGVANNQYIIAGLSYTNPDNNYTSVKYGWYTHTSGLTIYESGVLPPGTTLGTYGANTTTTKLRIAREHGKINYYKNGVLQRSVADAQPQTAMIVDFSFYETGRSIYGLEIGTMEYEAVDVMKTDYYPFGMAMPGRTVNNGNYRFGYNGMEQDKEYKGNGNDYTTEFRQYDPRLGRWMSLDPLMAGIASMSPYAAFNNSPISNVDVEGLMASESSAKAASSSSRPKFKRIHTFYIGRLQVTIRLTRAKWTGIPGGISFKIIPKPGKEKPDKPKKERCRFRIKISIDRENPINVDFDVPLIKYWDWEGGDEYYTDIPANSGVVMTTGKSYGGKFKVITNTHGLFPLPGSKWTMDDYDDLDLQGNKAYFGYKTRFHIMRPIEQLLTRSPKGYGLHPGFVVRNGKDETTAPISMYVNGTHKPNGMNDHYSFWVATEKIPLHIHFSLPRIKFDCGCKDDLEDKEDDKDDDDDDDNDDDDPKKTVLKEEEEKEEEE